ncbi:MAG TPA: regulatory protein RecX [Gaiellaceae bacterium]|nr:regulatory protein RecX [Gaiellaceae bacterium]
MPRVTALRPARPGHVLVELDGERWRTFPVDVAARSGLATGLELDRERLRTLRRELRQGEALAAGARVLARRDRSEQAVRAALERRGISEPDREKALATLRRHGALDDERYAQTRAAALAERGLGNAAIVFRLERDGVAPHAIAPAVAALEPENDRAIRLVARRGATAKTIRWLTSRGFAPESVESAVAAVADDAGLELG